jgi:hypothetical protein
MTVNFITIKSTGKSGYEVAHMSFPKRQERQVSLSVSKNSIEQCADKETAEVAAKKFAESKNLSYIPANASVITSIPFGMSGFLAMELTSDGGVIGRGSVIDRASSIAEAAKVAQDRGLSLVLPQ